MNNKIPKDPPASILHCTVTIHGVTSPAVFEITCYCGDYTAIAMNVPGNRSIITETQTGWIDELLDNLKEAVEATYEGCTDFQIHRWEFPNGFYQRKKRN